MKLPRLLRNQPHLNPEVWSPMHPEVSQRLLLAGAEQVAQRLRTLSVTVGPSSRAGHFYTRIRPKSLESANEKVVRKRRESKPGSPEAYYSYRDLTDYVGMRVVTLYDNQLAPAIDYILDIIRAGQHIPDALFSSGFVWDLYSEAIFYTRSRDPNDPYALCMGHVYDLVSRDCAPSSPDTMQRPAVGELLTNDSFSKRDRTGHEYSSGHLIFWATAHLDAIKVAIPCEFQLRTAVEDIWSEINHKLLYKSKPPDIWSREYQVEYDRSASASESLKEKIDALPALVDQFDTASRTADANIKEFWGRRPNPFEFSLVASLFFAIGSDVGAATHSELFQQYGQLIARARKIHSDGRRRTTVRSLLTRAVLLMYKVIEELERPPGRTSSGTFAGPDQILATERLSLCRLEILRLRAILVHYLEADTRDGIKLEKYPKSKRGMARREKICLELYADFCKYREEKLNVMPTTVVLYFKHLLAINIEKPIGLFMYETNLEQSYQSVYSDPTVPRWSIYRVLIPRQISSHLFTQVQEELEDLQGAGNTRDRMSSLMATLRTRTLRALDYAIRAADEYIDRRGDERRGDLIFTAGTDEDDFTDFYAIADICKLYIKTFDETMRLMLPRVSSDCARLLTDFLHRSVEAGARDNGIAAYRDEARRCVEIADRASSPAT